MVYRSKSISLVSCLLDVNLATFYGNFYRFVNYISPILWHHYFHNRFYFIFYLGFAFMASCYWPLYPFSFSLSSSSNLHLHPIKKQKKNYKLHNNFLLYCIHYCYIHIYKGIWELRDEGIRLTEVIFILWHTRNSDEAFSRSFCGQQFLQTLTIYIAYSLCLNTWLHN